MPVTCGTLATGASDVTVDMFVVCDDIGQGNSFLGDANVQAEGTPQVLALDFGRSKDATEREKQGQNDDESGNLSPSSQSSFSAAGLAPVSPVSRAGRWRLLHDARAIKR